VGSNNEELGAGGVQGLLTVKQVHKQDNISAVNRNHELYTAAASAGANGPARLDSVPSVRCPPPPSNPTLPACLSQPTRIVACPGH
jgi:hypothetical protein